MADDALDQAVARTRDARRRSRQRAARRGFRVHASVFAAVNLGLFAIWLLQFVLEGSDQPWFLYSVIGWGVGVLVHWTVIRKPFSGHGAP